MHCTTPPSMLPWGWSELLPICLALYRHCIREEWNGARAGLYVLRQVRLTPLKSFQQRCALTQHHIRVIFYDMLLSSLFWPLARHCHFDPPAVWEPCNFGRAWQPGSGQPYSTQHALRQCSPDLRLFPSGCTLGWFSWRVSGGNIRGRMASKERLYELWMLYYTKVSH